MHIIVKNFPHLLAILCLVAVPSIKCHSFEGDVATCDEPIGASDPAYTILKLIRRTAQKIADSLTSPEGPTWFEGSVVFISLDNELGTVNLTLDLGSYQPLPIANISPIAVDYDPVDHYLYWTVTNGIQRAKTNGIITASVETVVSGEGDSIDGIAVDWVARNLYWADATANHIAVSRLDGSYKKVILKWLYSPRAIALDPAVGKIYWSEWGRHPAISVTSLDGRNRKILVDRDLRWPNGIAIDYEGRLLYFADAGTDKIEVIDLEGNGRRLILNKGLLQIFGLSFLDGYLYWGEWWNVERMLVNDTTSREQLLPRNRGFGVKATYLQPPDITNACAEHNGGCSHLCFYTPEGVRCDCPDGSDMSVDQQTCLAPTTDDFM